MKHFLSIASILGTVLLSFSCGNKNEKDLKVTESFNSDALLYASNNLANFISVNEIAEIVNQNPEKIKVHFENYHAESSSHTLSFYWADGTQKSIETIDGNTIHFDNQNAIGVAFVKEITGEQFEKNFTSKEALQQAVDDLVNNLQIQADIAIEEAKYLAETAKNNSFEKLEGDNVLMFWEMPNAALHVYTTGIAFTVTTNFGDNERKSKQHAFQVADKIIKTYSNL